MKSEMKFYQEHNIQISLTSLTNAGSTKQRKRGTKGQLCRTCVEKWKCMLKYVVIYVCI